MAMALRGVHRRATRVGGLGLARRALSGAMAARVTRAVVANDMVEIAFADGHMAAFHPVWLVDHDPATLHPTSLQRQLDSATLDPALPVPDAISVQDNGAFVDLAWTATSGAPQNVRFDADWLRKHSYAPGARKERSDALCAMRHTWRAADLDKNSVTKVSASAILEDDAALRRGLEALVETGVLLVTDMPTTMEATEPIVRRFGPVRETFYGGIWDTAPKSAEQVNDTAYTKDGLHCHTDTCYLMDSPGLQLFNCVAQSGVADGLNAEGQIEGATKLLDGFKLIEDLQVRHPETYEFFASNPLKWHCIEDGVFVKSWAPVIQFEPGTTVLRQFRYNNYDLAPIDYLDADQIQPYYRHTKVLNDMLRSDEYISYVRLNVGEMVVIDNHRVCHGRTAFTGYRNMVGCYIGRDDWRSKLRSLSGGMPLVNDE
eukprot:CAMPEP_0202053564 /NCGR_PEP_ID=MMETSP0963-20130614/5930_1 /ASSEMBLY_ACC=CAM_ASM_000494 /TAXON_ID=4773 /ORGANISM="Schizochytrium aggregatum, Strain ATCC28209" /LENGTH=429 /DNA_ID=CAMNT_0048618911 /DNA_START=38 /DNA_END=1327 /DNA_ORIENTATION=+